MSLYYINDHLISEEVVSEGTWAQNSGEKYKRIMIRTTPAAVRKNDDGKFESFTRPICAHNCSEQTNMANTRISSVVTAGEDQKPPRITIRTSTDTRYDSDVFIIALPYEGVIQPFRHDPEALAIYKTAILRSDRFSIEDETGRYRRVLYLVCRPDYKFEGDEWYDDECNLEITFAHSNLPRGHKPGEEANAKWTLRTAKIRFGTNGNYDLSYTDGELPYESLNFDDFRNAPICELVEPIVIEPNTSRK